MTTMASTPPARNGSVPHLPRWIVSRRRGVVCVWAAAIVVLLPFAPGLRYQLRSPSRLDAGEAAQVNRALREDFSSAGRQAVFVISGVPGLGEERHHGTLEEVADALRHNPQVDFVWSPLDRGGERLVAESGSSAIFLVGLADEQGNILKVVRSLRESTGPVARALRDRFPGAWIDPPPGVRYLTMS